MDYSPYIKLPSGEFVPDRRSADTEMQRTLLKLVAKVETMETNVELKLQTVSDKISNLDEKLANRITSIEDKFDNHVLDEKDHSESIDDHDKKLTKIETYKERIIQLEQKYNELNLKINAVYKKVTDLESKPKDEVYKKWSSIKDKIFIGIISLIGAALIYVITRPEIWKDIFK